jgi:hypothetical protein
VNFSLACRENAQWRTLSEVLVACEERVVPQPKPSHSKQYTPATGQRDEDSLEALIDQPMLDGPIGFEEEAHLIKNGWQGVQ